MGIRTRPCYNIEITKHLCCTVRFSQSVEKQASRTNPGVALWPSALFGRVFRFNQAN